MRNEDEILKKAWARTDTCPEVSLRNGTKALVLAQRADSFTDGKNALVIRTLAAAHAETGQFNEALAAVRRAEQLAGEKGDQDLLAKLRKDAETYAASAPLRDAGYLGNGEDSK